MERERELYEYQHESPPHHSIQQQPQTIHMSPNHPHLRHVGHPQTSIICIQQPTTIIASNPTSQNPAGVVQNHTSQSTNQQQQPQPMSEQMHEIQLKKEAHYQHHQQNGEIRPSVIESNQPMVIECT